MPDYTFHTAITHIAPNEIHLRGYPIEQLMGRLSFGDAVYVVLRGELPPPNAGRLLDAVLVSSIDHGPVVPSALAARNAASSGAPLAACVAAGVLAMNRHHGGAIEACARTILDVLTLADEKSAGYDVAAEQLVREFLQRKERFAGFGHVLHTTDPRSVKLFDLAESLGHSGKHIHVCRLLESEIARQRGAPLPLNVDGAIAAVLLELGFDPDIMNGFFMIARVPGLIAHAREEVTRQRALRPIVPGAQVYDGPPRRDLPPG